MAFASLLASLIGHNRVVPVLLQLPHPVQVGHLAPPGSLVDILVDPLADFDLAPLALAYRIRVHCLVRHRHGGALDIPRAQGGDDGDAHGVHEVNSNQAAGPDMDMAEVPQAGSAGGGRSDHVGGSDVEVEVEALAFQFEFGPDACRIRTPLVAVPLAPLQSQGLALA